MLESRHADSSHIMLGSDFPFGETKPVEFVQSATKFQRRCGKRSWAPTRRAFWAWIFDARDRRNSARSANGVALGHCDLGGGRPPMPGPRRRQAAVSGRLIEHGVARDLGC